MVMRNTLLAGCFQVPAMCGLQFHMYRAFVDTSAHASRAFGCVWASQMASPTMWGGSKGRLQGQTSLPLSLLGHGGLLELVGLFISLLAWGELRKSLGGKLCLWASHDPWKFFLAKSVVGGSN